MQKRERLAVVKATEKANLAPKAITTEGESQTEFVDFSIFDKKDGWVLPISGVM